MFTYNNFLTADSLPRVVVARQSPCLRGRLFGRVLAACFLLSLLIFFAVFFSLFCFQCFGYLFVFFRFFVVDQQTSSHYRYCKQKRNCP